MSRGLGLFDCHKKIATQAYLCNRNNKFEIVDVRGRDEYDNEHISGALHVPLSQLKTARFHAQPNTTAVFHCRSGRRTQQHQMELRDWAILNGFKDVRFMIGGIEEWKARGLPTVLRAEIDAPKSRNFLAT